MEHAAHFSSEKILSSRQSGMGWTHWGPWPRGLFCSLLIGTILDTLGKQLGIAFLVTVGATPPP